MACVDTDDLNKLYAQATEGKPTVTLKYGYVVEINYVIAIYDIKQNSSCFYLYRFYLN